MKNQISPVEKLQKMAIKMRNGHTFFNLTDKEMAKYHIKNTHEWDTAVIYLALKINEIIDVINSLPDNEHTK